MNSSLAAEEWVSTLRTEYLEGFIASGGAAVKVAVPGSEPDRQRLLAALQRSAVETGYFFAGLDAATTRLHLIDRLFFAVAREVPWDDLAYEFLRKQLVDAEYRVPQRREEFSLVSLAQLNELPLGEMQLSVNKQLTQYLYHDYGMTQEFRMAMMRLCKAQLYPEEEPDGTTEAVKEWLCGDLRLVSALKAAMIFHKIGRSHGRHMLSSLARWLHLTARAGLVLTLDVSRFLDSNRTKAPDAPLYYSKPAVLDGYEVLRQFIDSTDEIEFCLLVVVAPPEWLTDMQRGVNAYDALKMRIWDEVRDRERVNPLSTLVRISA